MTPVGSLTWTCSSSGTYAESLVCRSPPPTPATDTFFINEMSPNGTYVGQVVAIPAFQDQTLTYAIVAESYRLNNTPSFALSSCGGTLRVNQPNIDYWDVAEHAINVSIFVYPGELAIGWLRQCCQLRVCQRPLQLSLGRCVAVC